MQEEKHCFSVWEQGPLPLWREAVEELHLIRVALENLVAIKVGEGIDLRSIHYPFSPPLLTDPPSTGDPLPEYPVITCGD